MGSIQQLQMSYSAEEDRVLLRINTTDQEEFRFWLTRRYCGLIIQALHAHRSADPDVSVQATPVAKQAVQDFKQEAANSEGNFDQPFQSADSYPLGETPRLAQTLKYRVETGKLVLTIEPKSGSGITITLDSKLNFNFTKLLQSAVRAGVWQLDVGQATGVTSGSDQKVVN